MRVGRVVVGTPRGPPKEIATGEIMTRFSLGAVFVYVCLALTLASHVEATTNSGYECVKSRTTIYRTTSSLSRAASVGLVTQGW